MFTSMHKRPFQVTAFPSENVIFSYEKGCSLLARGCFFPLVSDAFSLEEKHFFLMKSLMFNRDRIVSPSRKTITTNTFIRFSEGKRDFLTPHKTLKSIKYMRPTRDKSHVFPRNIYESLHICIPSFLFALNSGVELFKKVLKCCPARNVLECSWQNTLDEKKYVCIVSAVAVEARPLK